MQVISTLGRETINTPLYVQLDMMHCHLMTEMLCRYALVGEPMMGGKATKVKLSTSVTNLLRWNRPYMRAFVISYIVSLDMASHLRQFPFRFFFLCVIWSRN